MNNSSIKKNKTIILTTSCARSKQFHCNDILVWNRTKLLFDLQYLLIEIAHVVNLNVKSTSTLEIINQRKMKQIVN